MEEIKERVEFGCYTKMSEMRGISSVKEYIDEAVNYGWKAIGITDIKSNTCTTCWIRYYARRF